MAPSSTVITYLFPAVDAINYAYGARNHWRQILVAISQYQDLFHAVVIVLASAHQMIMTNNSSNGFEGASTEVLHHRGQAISNLRERLMKPNAQADDGAIMTILFLSVNITIL
jgi:hypothetical protein